MKKWKIECCDKCPKIGVIYKIDSSYNYCYKENKSLKNINTFNAIPKWCKLEDYNANNSR